MRRAPPRDRRGTARPCAAGRATSRARGGHGTGAIRAGEVAVPEEQRLVPRSGPLERQGDQPLRIPPPFQVSAVALQGRHQGPGTQVQPQPLLQNCGREDRLTDPDSHRRKTRSTAATALAASLASSARTTCAKSLRSTDRTPLTALTRAPTAGERRRAGRRAHQVVRTGTSRQAPSRAESRRRWRAPPVRAPVVGVEGPDQELPGRQRRVARVPSRAASAPGTSGPVVTASNSSHTACAPRRSGSPSGRASPPRAAGLSTPSLRLLRSRAVAAGRPRPAPTAATRNLHRRSPCAASRAARGAGGGQGTARRPARPAPGLVVEAPREHCVDPGLVGGDEERLRLTAARLLEQLLGEVERLARLARRDQSLDPGP